MKKLTSNLKSSGKDKDSFLVNGLKITYPGYKKTGDYRLSIFESGLVPKHTDVVQEIYGYTNETNYKNVIAFLDDIYSNGLNSTSSVFPVEFKEKIYWITLQEEINYPQPKYAGRTLPFQRYYEGVLAKFEKIELDEVNKRTNNRGRRRPTLLEVGNNIPKPTFYQ